MSVLLIDLSSLFWANWHATAGSELGEAVKRTVAQVTAYAQGHDHVGVCCDSPPYTHRKALLPEYKANREASPPLAREQLRSVRDRLTADGFALLEADGFEADDVIATAVRQCADHAITVISADKDLLQLVSDANDGHEVQVTSPMSGTTYDSAAVHAKHGVTPTFMVDFLALCGDKSDNVPGVPSVGPKTAAALLEHFGDLEGVLHAAANDDAALTKPAIKAALKEHAAAARLAKSVIQLRDDAPVDARVVFAERVAQPLKEVNAGKLDGDAPADSGPPPPTNGAELPQPKPAASAMVLRKEDWSLALEPRSTTGAYEVAGILHNSRMYPKYGTQAAIFTAIVRGRALGIDACTALASFHPMPGFPMHANLIVALVLRSGLAEYFDITECDSRHAVLVTKRVGSRHARTFTFTDEDAFRAKSLVRDPDGLNGYVAYERDSGKSGDSSWDKTRPTMLEHRVKTMAARAVYPDVVLSLYSPDEMGAEGYVDAEVST